MPEGYNGSKPDVQWWISAIQAGERYRDQMAYRDRWATWRDWNRGKFSPGILPSNVYFKMIRSQVPRIYFRNPSVSATASKPGLDYFILAKLLERIDNKLIDRMGVKGQMKRMVLHGCMFGTGFGFRGFGAEFTPSPDMIRTEAPDAGTSRLQNHLEYNSLIRPNEPWFLATHPKDVVIPAYTPDIYSARWVCRKVYRTRQDILDDPRFKDKDALIESIKPVRPTRSLIATNERRDGVVLWEIRDKKTGMVFVIAPATAMTDKAKGDGVIYQDADRLMRNNRAPAYPLVFNPDDEQFWGIPDSIIIEPQQIEKNEIRNQIRQHRRILLKKLLVGANAISPDEADKLVADDNVNSLIRVADINQVKPLEAGQIPPGLIEAENLIDQEVQEILGLGTNQFGEYAPGSADRSATEASIINQATQIRVDERRDTCADLLVELTQDMNDDIIEYWGDDMVADIAGPAGSQIWIKFQPELLAGVQWDLKVDPDSSIPLTKQYREQKASQLYDRLYGKNQSVDPNALTHFYLSQVYGTEADSILANPVMQTSQENPMPFGDAMQHIQQLPGAAQAAIGLPKAA